MQIFSTVNEKFVTGKHKGKTFNDVLSKDFAHIQVGLRIGDYEVKGAAQSAYNTSLQVKKQQVAEKLKEEFVPEIKEAVEEQEAETVEEQKEEVKVEDEVEPEIIVETKVKEEVKQETEKAEEEIEVEVKAIQEEPVKESKTGKLEEGLKDLVKNSKKGGKRNQTKKK